MTRRLSVAVIVLAFAVVPSISGVTVGASFGRTVFVTNSSNAGPGSFRAAVTTANANSSIGRIHFLGNVSTIALQQTITFTGSQDLTIDGNDATLNGANAGGPAFRATGGGDLSVNRLTVRNTPSEGLSIDVPTGTQGTVRVRLFRVDIIDNTGHGVLIDDQDDPTTPAVDGDSPASVDVSIINCEFVHNGFSVSDRDGLRVNEGGDGDIEISIWHSTSRENGADGIEVDEKGAGDVRVFMFGSHVTGNGEFDPGDLDDGFDIDESEDGSITGLVFHSTANDNFEEGFDFNENHAGDLRVDMYFVEASRNGEEGIDYEEDDDFAGGGDLVTTMFQVTANGNAAGDAGLKIREKGAGNLSASLQGIETTDNANGGISVREDADGTLVSDISRATSTNNGSHGIDFDENSTGNLTATVSHSTSSDNGGAGVRADQQLPGAGTLQLNNVTLLNNTGGPTTGSNVTMSGS